MIRAVLFALLLIPQTLLAQVQPEIVVTHERSSGMTFANLVNNIIVPVVDRGLIPLLYAFAFLFFLFGMVRLFFSDSEEKRQSGKQFALWGIIGFFVLFSVWGIVRLFLSLLPG